jgi:hypothetical protein
MEGGLPTCLDEWLMLLTPGDVRIVSVVSLGFASPQCGEDIPDVNFRLRLQLIVDDFSGSFCRPHGSSFRGL